MSARRVLTALSALLLAWVTAPLLHAGNDEFTFGLNPGYALTILDEDDGGESRMDGLFLAVEWEWQNGFLMRLSLSGSQEDGTSVTDLDSDGQLDAVSIPFETTSTRGDLVAGYRWNPGGTARPHVYAGLSRLKVEEEVGSVKTIDDSSSSAVIGFGLIVGSEHHWFTFDFVNDLDHEVDPKFSLQEVSYDYREVRLGWMYRW